MVAGAAGDDAARAHAVAQRGELVQRAADLERAGALQVLGLQQRRRRRRARSACATAGPACGARRRRSRRGRARRPRGPGCAAAVVSRAARRSRRSRPARPWAAPRRRSRARRRVGGEELGVGLVDLGERAHVGHVDGAAAPRRRACAPAAAQTALEVLAGTGAPARRACRRRARRSRVERDLAGAEQQAARAHGVAVGPDRGAGRHRR